MKEPKMLLAEHQSPDPCLIQVPSLGWSQIYQTL